MKTVGKNNGISESVQIQLTPRILDLLADKIYKDRLVFLRELTQNSYDAYSNAKKSEKLIKIEIRDNAIHFVDFATGMSYNFLKKDFPKIGHQFKKGCNIGFYGIGRLSIWKLQPTKVIIESATKNEYLASRVEWINPSCFTLSKVHRYTNEPYVQYSIYCTPPSFIDVVNYLKENIILDITFEIISENEYAKFNAKECFEEHVLYKVDREEYTFYITDLVYTRVFSKSILAKKLWIADYVAIDFKKDITTLSRDNITVSESNIREIVVSELKEFLLAHSEISGNIRAIVIDILQELKEEALFKLFPISKNLRVKDIQGKYVLVHDKIEKILLDKISKKFTVVSVSKKEYDVFSKYCQSLVDVYSEIAKLEGRDISDNFQYTIKQLENLESKLENVLKKAKAKCPNYSKYIINTINSVDDKPKAQIKEFRGYVVLQYRKVGKIISIVELDNNDIMAFADTLNYSICLNYSNETIAHELTHLLGFSHHSQDFDAIRTFLVTEMYKEMIQNQIVFEGKMSPHKVGAKGKTYIQHRISVPREVTKAIGNRKAKVRVTLEILETE